MAMKWFTAAVWVAAVALFSATGSAGCSSAPQQLRDGVYVSTPESTFDLADGSTLRMRVLEGRMSLNAGCNTLNGAYSIRDGRLVMPTLASTKIGCPPDLAAQDSSLQQFITGTPRFEPNGNALVLTDDAGVTLVMAPSDELPESL